MAVPPKKPFLVYSKALEAATKAVAKYSQQSRRSVLLVVEDQNGHHPFGTKHMLRLWNEDEDFRLKMCGEGRKDTRDLNSEDQVVVGETLPRNPSETTAVLYKGSAPAKLRCKVDLLSEKEAQLWLMPDLKKELAKKGEKYPA